MTTTQDKVRIGSYWVTSWGYDQTNYDYLIVERVSASGKTAQCRMIRPIKLGEAQQTDILMAGGERYGEAFDMQIRSLPYYDGPVLRGSYPYLSRLDTPQAMKARRLDTFNLSNLGDVHYETKPEFGH